MSSETMSPTEKIQKLKENVQEMVNSHYRVQAERDLQKSICENVKDQLEMLPTTFKKLSKLAYDNNAEKVNKDVTELLDLAEELGIYSHNADPTDI